MSKEIQKPIKEPYGASTIQLVEVDMTDDPLTEINVGNIRVSLPVLNLKKYDPNCHCYALIEKLKLQFITMVDLIYSYEELDIDRLTDAQKDIFFKGITRSNINLITESFPGMRWVPSDHNKAEAFKNAIIAAIQAEADKKFLLVKYGRENRRKKKVRPSPEEVKDDGLILEFVKSFYESLTLSRVKRPTDLVEKTVVRSTRKRAVLSKCGSIVISGVESGKYLSKFGTFYETKDGDKDPKSMEFRDMYSLYIAGVDDKRLFLDPEYKKRFGRVILQSDILETLVAANNPKLPRFLYGGEYNEDDERMELGENVGQAIKKLNESMFSKSNERPGEEREE